MKHPEYPKWLEPENVIVHSKDEETALRPKKKATKKKVTKKKVKADGVK